jgi:hypothetical protein
MRRIVKKQYIWKNEKKKFSVQMMLQVPVTSQIMASVDSIPQQEIMTPIQTFLLVFVLCAAPLVLAYFLIIRPFLMRATQTETRTESARSRLLAIVLGLVLLASSLFCLLSGGSAIRIASHAKNWPKTSGEIISSKYWRRSMTDGQDQYIVEITYQYSVNGTTYTSDNIGWTSRFDAFSSRNQAEEIVAKFPAGSPIYVFYNPEDPHQSALDPGTDVGPESIVIGLLLLGAGIYAVWWAVKKGYTHVPAMQKTLRSVNGPKG